MSRCKKPECKFNAWRQRLCYQHWRTSHGWTFNPLRKVFVRTKQR
jgi:hypothetical protein